MPGPIPPLGLEVWQAAWLALSVLGAAWVRGYSGFGFSALVITSAALVMDPVPLVATLVMCEIVLSLGQARGVWRQVDWRRTWTMLAGAAVVMPFSFALVARMGEDVARIAIAGMVLVLCLVMARGWQFRGPVGWPGNVGAGMASGLANGAAMGGLPVAAFLAGQPVAPGIFRATMIGYLTLVCLIALPSLWATGLLDWGSLVLLGAFVPLMAAGLWLGGRRFHAASPRDFKRFTLLLLGGLAVAGLVRGLW